MRYKIELKIDGRTAYYFWTEDISEQELERKKDETLSQLGKNRFTRNLPLTVVATAQNESRRNS